MEFEWGAGNRKHIARHSITPEEAEEAAAIEPLEAAVQQHEREERMLCFGRTKAGRLLTILYTMPKKPITIPKFRTEAQEADWWDTHPEAATEIMRRAIKSGKARRAAPLKTVTMRLPLPDILAAQDLAHQKGLPYQTYIKMLLHEALKKERSA